MGKNTTARILGVTLLSLVVLGGCRVGPDYVPPDTKVPDAWQMELTEGLETGEANLHTWWTTFGDPVLDDLIHRAATGNIDLRVALARIRAARAQAGIAESDWYPTVDAGGDVTWSRISEGVTENLPPGTPRNPTNYRAGFDAFWEVDLWGRIGRSVESADARLGATVEDYRDLLVVLFAEVAVNYFEVRSIQQRIVYAEQNISSQRQTLELTQNRLEAEIAPELDVEQAKLNLANTESALPVLREGLHLAVNRLSVLLGEQPGGLKELLTEVRSVPRPPEQVVVGVPAELLRQRPDIRAAERRLAAQTARIGVATADLYPSFRIFGSLGLESQGTADFFSASSLSYVLQPTVTVPVFNADRIRNRIRVEEAGTEEALAFYENTVLLALEEVEDALVSYAQERARRDAVARTVAAAERSVELVMVLYRTGVTDFQNVLDMERTLAIQQDLLAESEGRVVQNLVRVYKALGGGWKPEDPDPGGEVPESASGGS